MRQTENCRTSNLNLRVSSGGQELKSVARFIRLGIGYVPKSIVHRRRIGESCSDVWIKDYDVAAFLEPLPACPINCVSGRCA